MNQLTDHESDIYRKYRHFLSAQPKAGTHAAARRQQARVLTVSQFGTPFAEVKRIVALGDQAHGITHEAPIEPDPLNGLKIERLTVAQLQVGDRVKYPVVFDTDARIVAIDGYKITMQGLSWQQGSRKVKETFTYDLSPDKWEGREMTLPVVVNRERRVPANRA